MSRTVAFPNYFVHQYVDGVSSKTVALTIDDGPDATYTPEVLDILHAHGARATFFVVGRRAQALPDLVHREIAEGHEIGNHTMTHVGWNDKSYDESLAEILEAQKAISSVTGSEPVFFRSPHGQNTKANAQAIVDSHLQAVRWTIGVEHHASGSAQAEADRVAAADPARHNHLGARWRFGSFRNCRSTVDPVEQT